MDTPIRILHIVQRLEAGGTQALLMNIYRNIDRNKIQFDFLVEYPNKQFYDDEVFALGGRVFYSSVRVDFKLLKFKKYFSELLKKEKYKIIHMHMSNVGYLCFKEAKKQGVKVRIAHNHNNGSVHGWKDFPRYILGKLYTVYATDFYACSKEAGEYRFKHKPYKVLRNGIDSSKFIYNFATRNKIRDEYKMKDKFVVGHVGRFHPQKNHTFLLDIFKKIVEKKPNAMLMLVGEGDLEGKIKNKINDLQLTNNVIFTGNKANVNELLQAMDIFIFPSLFEGLGIVAIESQAACTPILCSDNVSKEVEISPLCFKMSLKKSAEEWAEKAFEIYNNHCERKNMQEFVIKSGFDIKNVAQELQKFYIEKYEKNYK